MRTAFLSRRSYYWDSASTGVVYVVDLELSRGSDLIPIRVHSIDYFLVYSLHPKGTLVLVRLANLCVAAARLACIVFDAPMAVVNKGYLGCLESREIRLRVEHLANLFLLVVVTNYIFIYKI